MTTHTSLPLHLSLPFSFLSFPLPPSNASHPTSTKPIQVHSIHPPVPHPKSQPNNAKENKVTRYLQRRPHNSQQLTQFSPPKPNTTSLHRNPQTYHGTVSIITEKPKIQKKKRRGRRRKRRREKNEKKKIQIAAAFFLQ